MSRKRYWEDEGRSRYWGDEGRSRFWEDSDHIHSRYDEEEAISSSNLVPADYVTLSPQLRAYVESMKVALQQLIADAENAKETFHEALGGEPISTVIGKYIYQYTLKQFWDVEENSRVYILLSRITKQRMVAKVVTVAGTQLTFVTTQPVPDDVLKDMVLIEDKTWLLNRQLQMLTYHLRETDNQLASKVFDCLPVKSQLRKFREKLGSFVPNAKQKRAIEHALGSEFTIVNGPGGTGKSAVLSNVALRYMKKTFSVVSSSHTNIATDNLFLRQVQAIEQSGDADLQRLLEEGRIVRAGEPRHSSLLVGPYAHLTVDAVARKRMGDHDETRRQLEQELQNASNAIARLEKIVSQRESELEKIQAKSLPQRDGLRLALQTLEEQELQRIKRAIEEHKRKQRDTEAELAPLQQVQQSLEDQLNYWTRRHDDSERGGQVQGEQGRCEQLLEREKLALAQLQEEWQKSLLKWLWSIRHEQEVKQKREWITTLQERVDEADRAVTLLQDKLRLNASQQLPLQTALKHAQDEQKRLQKMRDDGSLSNDVLTLRGKLEQVEQELAVSKTMLDQAVSELEQEGEKRSRIVAHLDELKMRLVNMKAQVIKDARLVATTISTLYLNPTLLDREFDVVMIDEISMIALVGVLIAVSHARRHVVVAGDAMQLAPILKINCKEWEREKKMPEALKWLGQDLLTYLHVTIFDAIAERKGCILLTEQGRMHPKILAPLNHFVYQDMLTSRAETERAPRIGPLPDCPLMLVDSSASPDSLAYKPSANESRVNDHHVEVIVALLPQIIATLPPLSPSLDSGSPRIGVLVPYRSQARRLLRVLRKAHLTKHIHVGTVHTVQSLEFDVVIFDTVDARGKKKERTLEPFAFTFDCILDDRQMATGATRLLTVAHGRAKYKLIYIAHLDHLRACRRGNERLLVDLVEWANKEGHMSSTEVIAASLVESKQ